MLKPIESITANQVQPPQAPEPIETQAPPPNEQQESNNLPSPMQVIRPMKLGFVLGPDGIARCQEIPD